MSNIKERRKNSAKVPENGRAKIVNSDKKQKRSFGRGLLIALIIVVLLAAAALVVVNFLIDRIADSVVDEGNYKDVVPSDNLNTDYIENNGIFSSDIQEHEKFKDFAYLVSQSHSAVVNNIKDTENVFNYCIYGVDSSTNDVDVIIIASINKDTKALQYVLLDDKMLVSIPYADVVGCLEDAFGIGSANLLSRTIAQNFGIDIDGYVVIDMEGVASLGNHQSTSLEIDMTVEEIKALNESIVSFNKRFENVEGFEKLYEFDDTTARTVKLEGYYVVAYARGKDGLDDNAIFKLLAESTKAALKNGVAGAKELAELLRENAKSISTSTEDFSTLLQLVAVAASDVLASVDATDFAEVLAKDKLQTKTVYTGPNKFVSFVIVEDYAAMVAELQNKLYK